MKTYKSYILSSIAWLIILVSYVAALLQLPGGVNLIFVIVAGLACAEAAQTWSNLLIAHRGEDPADYEECGKFRPAAPSAPVAHKSAS
ncbi:MAG: hypothetical protein ACI4OM_02620 [Evtepia sp.]